MLSEQDYIKIERQANKLYSNLENEIVKEIAKRINGVGYANTVVENNAKILQEMGILYSNVITIVAKETESSFSDISKILSDAGVKSIAYDDKIYIEAGLNPIKINQSPSMVQLINATIANTSNNLSNLVKTTAETSQTSFYNAMNMAYLETSTGAKSYSQSIIDAIENIGENGVTVKYPSGYQLNLESAVKTNILTSTSQMCGKLQMQRAEELDWDLMEITAHSGARPTHAEWQGKVVSLSGKKGYLSLETIGYGTVTGFKGINCRHDWFPYYEGSSRSYDDETLERYKKETVKYDGKEMSLYDATQIQRKMENTIRADKRKLVGLQELMNNTNLEPEELTKLKTAFAKKSLTYNRHKTELNDLTNQTEQIIDDLRTVTKGYGRSTSEKVSDVTYIANKYNNSDLIGTTVNGTKISRISEHIISRTYARELTFEDVEDCLKNPLKYDKIKIDKQGRRSFAVIGEKVTVYVDPDTGTTTTVHATHTQLAEKLKKENETKK